MAKPSLSSILPAVFLLIFFFFGLGFSEFVSWSLSDLNSVLDAVTCGAYSSTVWNVYFAAELIATARALVSGWPEWADVLSVLSIPKRDPRYDYFPLNVLSW